MKFPYIPESEADAARDPEVSPQGGSRAEPVAQHEFSPANRPAVRR